MKIGYDGKRAFANFTGLGNYSRHVVGAVARSYPGDELTLFSPLSELNERVRGLTELPNVNCRFPEGGETLGGGSVWRTLRIPGLLGGYDVYHGLSNELPWNIGSAGVASVVTMHDVIYRRMPECYKGFDRKLYDLKYGRSCRVATRVIAISECTKRDVMHYYGVAEDRIDVVYQGIDDNFRRKLSTADVQEVLHRYGIETGYVVQVGSIERRKNAMLSVRALTGLHEGLKLVLVGRRTPYLDECLSEAERLGVRERVKVLEGVKFEDLPGLYKGAEVSLYPSRYEGFGLPVVEALSCGTPTIAATGSCLEEAGGRAALYVDGDDVRGMAEAIRVITEPGFNRARMVKVGLMHAAKFTEDATARGTHEVYERAVREYGGR